MVFNPNQRATERTFHLALSVCGTPRWVGRSAGDFFEMNADMNIDLFSILDARQYITNPAAGSTPLLEEVSPPANHFFRHNVEIILRLTGDTLRLPG